MFVNVSGAQNLSRSIRKIILDKMPLIEVGHESYFDTLNREETRNPFYMEWVWHLDLQDCYQEL